MVRELETAPRAARSGSAYLCTLRVARLFAMVGALLARDGEPGGIFADGWKCEMFETDRECCCGLCSWDVGGSLVGDVVGYGGLGSG